MPIDNYTAVGRIEGFEPCDGEEQYIEACQHLIDNGQAWKLQGSLGRLCQSMIDEGKCQPFPRSNKY